MAKKAKILKPYSGPLGDLVQFTAEKTQPDFWVVRLHGVTYTLNKKTFHLSEGRAKAALRYHIFCNFCQGHYWHEGKNNTFAEEKGWMRNNGAVGTSRPEFKVFAQQMTDWLLDQKIFTLDKISV